MDAPLSNVSYQVRELLRLGAVQIVTEAPVRGSIAHVYEETSLVPDHGGSRRQPLVLGVDPSAVGRIMPAA